ncbi:MAG TPA: glycosyltransferase family 39 protein [Acidimicrobiales bacterium]|nr:glycosyltransferase family 39 protein [Acidimicrobiales bacterium]
MATRLKGAPFSWWLVGIMALGLVVRVGYVWIVGPHLKLGLDATWYELQAGTLAEGKGYVDPDSFYRLGRLVPTATFPPLWPMLLAAANHLGVDTQTGSQLVGGMLGTVTVGLTGLLGRRVAGPAVGLVAALLVACCALLIAADGSLMSDSLYVMLVVLVVLSAYRALDRPTPARFAVVGLTLGLAALARSDALFLIAILAGTLAWRVRGVSAGRRVALVGCLLGGTVIAVTPWIAYSSSRMGGFVILTTNSGNELVGSNCPSTYHGSYLGAWDPACVPPTPTNESELRFADASRRTGLDFAEHHPARLPVVVTARVLRAWGFWSPLAQEDLEVGQTRNPRWQTFGWGYDLVMLFLAVPGTVILVRKRAQIAPLVAVVSAVTVTAALSHGNSRYRLGADPIIAVAAAVFLINAWQQASTRRSSPSTDAASVSTTLK